MTTIDFDYYREQLFRGLEPGKPNSKEGIRNKLKAYRNEWFEKFKEENPDKNKPKALPELAVAKGLNKYTHVITLENGKVALYDPERGYYQKDYRYAYQLIYILEPTFNETKCRNVLFLLSNMSREYEYNRMRMDFEPEYRDVRRFILVKNGSMTTKKETTIV